MVQPNYNEAALIIEQRDIAMKEDRKKGLLLIDHLTCLQGAFFLCHFLRDALQSSTTDLTIGVVSEGDQPISLQDMPPFLRIFKAQSIIIPYTTSLTASVSAQLDPTDLDVMLVSTTHFLVDEAQRLSWNAIKVPNVQGELSRSHLDSFRQALQARLATRDLSQPPLTLVISLDMDETFFFQKDSVVAKKFLWNPKVLWFLQNISEEYKANPFIKIEMVVVTARNEADNKAYHTKGGFFSAERIMAAFLKKISDFFQGAIPVYFTEQKYTKLGELYGSRNDIFVLHVDDNTNYTNAFDSGMYPNIKYVSVNSEKAPEFIFPVDKKALGQWCRSYASPAVVLNTESQTNAFFRPQQPSLSPRNSHRSYFAGCTVS